MNVLDLFSGIGGFSLGLERAGMRTIAFCEIEPYCRAVLAKHWPGVPCHSDIRELTADRLGERIDVICGGFPCQDISFAGDGVGLAGARSGLWSEYRRVIDEVRPQWAIIENVSALRSRGLEAVLRELAASGYDAEWYCIPAAAVGAPHRRDRIWIVAYPNCGTRELRRESRNFYSPRNEAQSGGPGSAGQIALPAWHGGADVAYAHCPRLEGWLSAELRKCASELLTGASRPSGSVATAWFIEPNVGRVADGVPNRAHRLRALGNAVVPQIPEIIGRAILAYERATSLG